MKSPGPHPLCFESQWAKGARGNTNAIGLHPPSDQKVPVKIMLPHVWFHTMHEQYPRAFQDLILSGQEPRSFWEAVHSWPGYTGLGNKEHIDVDKCVPFFLHGDGAPVTGVGKSWSMSALTLSITSVLCRGPTKTHQHTVAVLWEDALVAGISSEEVFLILGWSFYWLLRGVWPRSSHTRTSA